MARAALSKRTSPRMWERRASARGVNGFSDMGTVDCNLAGQSPHFSRTHRARNGAPGQQIPRAIRLRFGMTTGVLGSKCIDPERLKMRVAQDDRAFGGISCYEFQSIEWVGILRLRSG